MNKQITVTLDANEHALICRALEVQIGILLTGGIYIKSPDKRLAAAEALHERLGCLEKSDEQRKRVLV